ncbi:MAG TPA: DUF167 domain-containing protein [Desulfobulbus sp.]|nr:DUF167 domain-containing protein [Desulfobulbus sp.]
MPFLQNRPDGTLLLKLHVQPRASRNRLAGLHGDALKLCLTTPPVDGRANKALVAFLAKLLHLPKSALEIRSGLQGRSKQVLLHGIDEETARRLLSGES